jgi:hypothetical protein
MHGMDSEVKHVPVYTASLAAAIRTLVSLYRGAAVYAHAIRVIC